MVAPESLRRFPERRAGRKPQDETENKSASGRLGSGHRAGRAGWCGSAGLGLWSISPRAAPAAAAAPGAVPQRGSPRTENLPNGASPILLPPRSASWTLLKRAPGVSHLPAHLSPALEPACHAPCQASGVLPAPGVVLLWQSAALIINLCRKQIQKPLLSFTAWNSALPTVPSCTTAWEAQPGLVALQCSPRSGFIYSRVKWGKVNAPVVISYLKWHPNLLPNARKQ